MPERLPRVIIVGAGFGGLEAAKALKRTAADVFVVDRQNHHCFQPLLYQVATASLSPADVAWPTRHILRDQQNATVLMEEVTGVDTGQKRLRPNSPTWPTTILLSRRARRTPISVATNGRPTRRA
jgi:NADH dehydrogenase